MARKLYCANCGSPLHRDKVFTCKNHLQMGKAPCFKGGLKKDVLYTDVLERVKQYIEPELIYYKSFSLSDLTIIENTITELKEKKAELFNKFFDGVISKERFEEKKAVISSEITAKEADLKSCRKIIAMNTKYKSERPIDTLKKLYQASELTKEHMQFVQRINVFNSKEFEIIMQEDNPLTIMCRNMNIYEED